MNLNVADVIWAYGLSVMAAVGIVMSEPQSPSILAPVLLLLWSLRLGTYLARSRLGIGKKEDARYQNLRERYPSHQGLVIFIIFLMQGVMILLFSLPPFFVILSQPSEWLWPLIGMTWGLACIAGEALADFQLRTYQKSHPPSNAVFRSGLWAYTRHPNYFFEWMFWWSFVFMTWGTSYWAAGLLGPIVMGIFLWKVTGIASLEAQSVKKRPDYARYQQEVSAFFPWFPKS
jgi:steroid 5-alpha reductase family enzyme